MFFCSYGYWWRDESLFENVYIRVWHINKNYYIIENVDHRIWKFLAGFCRTQCFFAVMVTGGEMKVYLKMFILGYFSDSFLYQSTFCSYSSLRRLSDSLS